MSPESVFPVLAGAMRSLQTLLDSAFEPTRARLLTTAAHFAEYTGWMAQEAGDETGALYWTDQAVELSRDSGRKDMASYALVRRALIELYREDGRATVELARRAQADREVPDRILGLGALREGQGHALNRDPAEFESCMARARDLLGADGGHSDSLTYGTTNLSDPVRMATGWSLYELGRPAEGAEILHDELRRHPAGAQRSYGRYAVRCALEYAAAGDVGRACEVAVDTLPRLADVVSATIGGELRRLSKELWRHRDDERVRTLLPDLTAALRNRPPKNGRGPRR